MRYESSILAAHADPRTLEDLYLAARRDNALAEFAADLLACHAQAPDNLLYGAWFCRLQPAQAPARTAGEQLRWRLAIPLGLLSGLAIWLLSRPPLDRSAAGSPPLIFYFWAPIVALAIVALLAIARGRHVRRAAALALGLAAASAYAYLLRGPARAYGQYPDLMLLHLPALAWIAVVLSVVDLRPDRESLFAVLAKSIEVLIVGGVYLLAGALFAAITTGLFSALQVDIPRDVFEFFAFVGAGAIPALALVSVYDPRLAPLEQRFEQGLGRLLPTLTRVLLPLAVVVLLVYLVAIPFNFAAPFENRELLVIYNVLLFAVLALLAGATPLRADDLSPSQQALLRLGIIVLAGLTILVSVYALSAVVYRTALGGFTPNRVTVIGWNLINIGVLSLLVYRQLKRGREPWLGALHDTFRLAAPAYVAWTLFLILATPWLFL